MVTDFLIYASPIHLVGSIVKIANEKQQVRAPPAALTSASLVIPFATLPTETNAHWIRTKRPYVERRSDSNEGEEP